MSPSKSCNKHHDSFFRPQGKFITNHFLILKVRPFLRLRMKMLFSDEKTIFEGTQFLLRGWNKTLNRSIDNFCKVSNKRIFGSFPVCHILAKLWKTFETLKTAAFSKDWQPFFFLNFLKLVFNFNNSKPVCDILDNWVTKLKEIKLNAKHRMR